MGIQAQNLIDTRRENKQTKRLMLRPVKLVNTVFNVDRKENVSMFWSILFDCSCRVWLERVPSTSESVAVCPHLCCESLVSVYVPAYRYY